MSRAKAAPRRPLLIAGIGNVLFGDDGFGVEVVRRIARRPLPDGVRAVDFGIRGFDLACALLEGYDAVILVDAMARGGAPGTLYVVEPDLPEPIADGARLALEPHALDPAKVLRLSRAMGAELGRLRVVGCEPASLGGEDGMAMGLSAPVEAALEPAVALVESLARELVAPGAADA